MVNSVQTSDAAAELFASMSQKKNESSDVSDTQNRFLKLLVTQMQNQDPMNPMENAQVTSQMAQLSTVTGIDKLNETFKALSDSMRGNQSLQAAGMIGRDVLLDGNNLSLNNGRASGAVDLPDIADQVEISITDPSGVLVRNLSLGPHNSGIARWEWDGVDNDGNTVKDGNYSFSVKALRQDENIGALPLQSGRVVSVTQGSEGVTLGVGQQDDIALSQVRQIR